MATTRPRAGRTTSREDCPVKPLPVLLALLLCSCARETPRRSPAPPPAPPPAPAPVTAPTPVRVDDPALVSYGPAVAAYLLRVRPLPGLVRPGSNSATYAKALAEAEEYYGRIPYAPAGAKGLDRAVRALHKAADQCRLAFVRFERSTAVATGMRRLGRGEGEARELGRLDAGRQAEWEGLRQSAAAVQDRLGQAEALLAPPRPQAAGTDSGEPKTK